MSSKEPQRDLKFGPFRLDAAGSRLLRDGHTVALTPKALEALALLLAGRGTLVTRDEFLKAMWPDTFVEDGNLTSTIWMARRALAEYEGWIETVPKRGYRFTGPVVPIDESPADEPAPVLPGGGDVPAPRLPQARTRTWAAALLLVVLAIAGFAMSNGAFGARLFPPATAAPQSTALAVLPFKDLSPDASQKYLAEGLTDALITELTRNPALQVSARTSSMQMDEATMPVDRIAAALNVDTLIRGSVVRAGDHVRVNTQVVDAHTGRHVWAEAFDGDLNDVIGLQVRMAEAVALATNAGRMPAREVRRVSVSSRAQERYLRGRESYYLGINTAYPARADFLATSIEHYRAALHEQPDWAEPWAGIAQAAHWTSEADPDRFFAESREAALKAIALDDSLADGHGALAYVAAAYYRDLALAEREFRRAVTLDPGTRYRHGFAMLLTALGRADEAETMYAAARRDDPMVATLEINAAYSLLLGRRFDRAQQAFAALAATQPPVAALRRAQLLLYANRAAESIGPFRQLAQHGEVAARAGLVCALAKSARTDEASAEAVGFLAAVGTDDTAILDVASTHLCLGNPARALAELERAERARHSWFAFLNVDPRFDELRDDPGFHALLLRLGVPEHDIVRATPATR